MVNGTEPAKLEIIRHSFGFDLGCNLRLGASRLKYEVRAYFRRGGTVFFTFRWIRKDS
jgi:hypothetical protein